MSINRRQFLKNASIGTAGIVGATSMLKTGSAFASYPCAATSDVSFVGGDASYTGGRKQMILDVLAPFKSYITTAMTGKNVVIKPNLVGGSAASCTHVDAIKGVIEFLRSINSSVPITIGECSASGTTTMFNTAGYNALTTAYTGITLVDLGSNPTAFPRTTVHLWKTDLKTTQAVYATSAFMNPNNFVISVAKPKTHNCMVITGVTKNMCMGMPYTTGPSGISNSKQAMHDGTPGGTRTGEEKVLASNIFQLATQMFPQGNPGFAVLDAWEGMDHNGPDTGQSVMQYCAVAGPDALAVDRLNAKLTGLTDTATVKHPVPVPTGTQSYTDMRALCWMSNANMGNFYLDKINFVQGTLANLTTFVKQYVLHQNYTASQAYETNWMSDTTWGPATVLDSQGVVPKSRQLYLSTDARWGYDGIPIMNPQANLHAEGVVTTNQVKIDLFLPAGYQVNLGIYNLKGQEVRRLGSEYLNNGHYSVVWDCRDANGGKMANGNYIIKLQAGQHQMCDKITLMR